MRANRQARPSAFTLVEMLVVVVIIAILAGLLLPAVNRARGAARTAQIAIEIKNLEAAFEAYKLKYGDYPPDFSDRDVVKRHIYTAWPNIDQNEFDGVARVFWWKPAATLSPTDEYYHVAWVNPAEALAFWLGGFSSNPKLPFTGTGGPFRRVGNNYFPNPERVVGLYDLEAGRLDSSDGDYFPVYLPPGKKKSPYVYFDARTYGGRLTTTTYKFNGFFPLLQDVATSDKGRAKPYLTERTSTTSGFGYEWANKNTFQIISAGADDHYGSELFLADRLSYPRPTDTKEPNFMMTPGDGDDDNITNFSEGRRLQDLKP